MLRSRSQVQPLPELPPCSQMAPKPGKQRWTIRLPRSRWRFSFRSFVILVLLLALLTYLPALFFHSRLMSLFQGRGQNCEWLQNPPLVCAHGGDSSRAPPNTLEAYRLALNAKVDCIEIDASRTRDGVMVALHDRDLQNIYGHDIVRVGDLTLDKIKKLNAGHGYPIEFQNQEVPTLKDALQFASRSLKQIIIDVKIGRPLFAASLIDDIISVVNETQCKNCLVWSKSDHLVQDLRRLSPEIMSGYIVMKDPISGKVSDLLRMEGVEVVGVYYGLVNDKTVSDIHSAGKKIHVWTVNDRESMKKMLKRRVDCIVTSYPSELQEVMTEIKQRCKEEGYGI